MSSRRRCTSATTAARSASTPPTTSRSRLPLRRSTRPFIRPSPAASRSFRTKMANPFPTGVAEPVGAAAGYQTFLGQGFSYFNQNPKIPLTNRWELGLQHSRKGYLFEANYIGNKSNHLELSRNINALPAQYLSTSPVRDDTYNNLMGAAIPNPMQGLVPGNTQSIYTSSTTSRQTLLSPYPAFGSSAVHTTENTGYSWYHSFQLTASTRFSRCYTLQGSYTYQKW